MKAGGPAHVFTCRPLRLITLEGQLAAMPAGDAFDGGGVELHAAYMASWADRFFGTSDGAVPSIPLGEPAYLTDGRHFQFALPDFASDPLTASGSLHIWAKEKLTGNLVALLVPTGGKTKIDSLKVASHYPANLVFAPCAASAAPVRDRTGFAIRGRNDPCFSAPSARLP